MSSNCPTKKYQDVVGGAHGRRRGGNSGGAGNDGGSGFVTPAPFPPPMPTPPARPLMGGMGRPGNNSQWFGKILGWV